MGWRGSEKPEARGRGEGRGEGSGPTLVSGNIVVELRLLFYDRLIFNFSAG